MSERIQSAHSPRGMVLIEAITTCVIVGIVLSVLPAFYFAYVNIWQRDTARLGAATRADLPLWRMQKEIRNARSLTLSPDGDVLTLALPKQRYDTELARHVNDLDSAGQLMDGDRVIYYFVRDPYNTGSSGGALYRRVIRTDDTGEPPRLVTDGVYPDLNPLAEGTGDPHPIFAYDGDLRIVTITVTAAEPKPSRGTFAVRHLEPMCIHDGGSLIRVASEEHPEGQIACTRCGSHVRPSAEIVAYQTQLLLRNE